MAKFRFHKALAIVVLIGTAAWVATGEFSSVGSAATDGPGPTAPQNNQNAGPVRTVGVVNPPRKEHARAIRIAGRTEADKRSMLATRAAGIVAELPVKQGTRVKAGDLILKLDNQGKEAALATTQQLLSQRESEAEAAQRLNKAGSLPRLQLDAAMSALAQARSQVEAAQAELDRNLIRAPFDGLIDKVNVELGSPVAAGAQVATLLNLDPLLGIGELNERDLGHIKPGDKAELRLVNDQTVTGTVRFISRDATAATRTYRFEVAIPNADGAVPAGMTAEITLRAEPVEATVLPRSVVTLSSTGDLGIRAVDKDNKVVFYPIDIVDDVTDGLVLGGIPANVRIIVAGQELISEGDTVNAVQADEATMRRLSGQAGQTQ